MPRRQNADVARNLPVLPDEATRRRDQQIKIRLTSVELAELQTLRPDLTPSGIVSLLVDEVLQGRYRPDWAAPASAQHRAD
jgi:hypothetical protein